MSWQYQILADQLNISQQGGGGHIMPTTWPPGFSDLSMNLEQAWADLAIL